MQLFSEIRHKHHPFGVKMLAKYIRGAISALFIIRGSFIFEVTILYPATKV